MVNAPNSQIEVVRMRLEAQTRNSQLIERVGGKNPRIELLCVDRGTRNIERPVYASGSSPALLDPLQSIAPLVPSGNAAFLNNPVRPKRTLLIDCSTLGLEEVKEFWYTWPQEVAAAQITGVLIVSDPRSLILAVQGACVEWVPLLGKKSSRNEKKYFQSKMEFIKRKYGTKKILRIDRGFFNLPDRLKR